MAVYDYLWTVEIRPMTNNPTNIHRLPTARIADEIVQAILNGPAMRSLRISDLAATLNQKEAWVKGVLQAMAESERVVLLPRDRVALSLPELRRAHGIARVIPVKKQ